MALQERELVTRVCLRGVPEVEGRAIDTSTSP